MQGADGRAQEVEAVIDTGFSGFLTLPSALVTAFGLGFDGVGWGVLADGTEASFDMYDATLLWDGQPRSVYVYAAETTPLVGMRLLEDHDLHVEVQDGGRVTVEAR